MVHKISHSSYLQSPSGLKELDFYQHRFPRRREHSHRRPEQNRHSMLGKSGKYDSEVIQR